MPITRFFESTKGYDKVLKFCCCRKPRSSEDVHYIPEKMSFLSPPEPGIGVQCDLHLDTPISADVGVQCDLYPNVLTYADAGVQCDILQHREKSTELHEKDVKEFLVLKGHNPAKIHHILNPTSKYFRNYTQEDICHGLTLKCLR